MICGVIGDYIGSIYEDQSISSFNLPMVTPSSHITDESVAIADVCSALVSDNLDFAEIYLKWFNRFPDLNYGFGTKSWIMEEDVNYVGNSDGNQAASREAPIGYLKKLPLSLILEYAEASARPTHNSEDGINGSMAISYTIHSILNGKSQSEIFNYLFCQFGYLMDFYTLENIKNTNETGSSAYNTVPMAIYLGMSGNTYADSLRNVLYINSNGLDTDSIGSMASSVAFAYHFGGNAKNANKDKEYKKLEFETKKYLFQSKKYHPILNAVQ